MGTNYFDTVEALDDLRSKAVKKAAGIESKEKKKDDEAPKEVDHVTALDQVESEMADLRDTGRQLMKKGEHNSPAYDELVARSKVLWRKKRFLEDSSKD